MAMRMSKWQILHVLDMSLLDGRGHCSHDMHDRQCHHFALGYRFPQTKRHWLSVGRSTFQPSSSSACFIPDAIFIGD
jgi:hypothetical protein